MKSLVLSKETAVWLLLAALTGLTWNLGGAQSDANIGGVLHYATIALFVVAFFKVRLVIMYFMEVARAPLPLRLVFEIWVVVICTVLIALLTLYRSA